MKTVNRSTIATVPGILGIAALSVAASFQQSDRSGRPALDPRLVAPPSLTPAERAQFARGRELFDKDFHRSEGVGSPEMNADSCRACHHDPILGGSGGLEVNVSRFAKDNAGAGPFQNLPGGQGASKLYGPDYPGREEIPIDADVFEQRQTPAMHGDGLLESVFVAAILENEDPNDDDGDGIRGVARWIDIGGTGALELGRFGWKAQVPTLADFVKDAMGGECGITTPDDGRGFAMLADGDPVADPEMTQSEVDDIAFFLRNLPAPERQGGLVSAGEDLFDAIGCAKCHVPALLGPSGPVAAYTDLLLHDVMPDDYRGMDEPGAGVGMFRTPPLWGIRATDPYMHDGRAEDLTGAILAHYGEADAVKAAFVALTPTEQAELIAFLEDL